jgi:cell division protein DivIC
MSFVNRKTIIPLLLILILLFIIKNIVNSIIELRQNSLIVTSLQENQAEEQKRGEFLKEQLFYVKTDDFIQNQARDKLGMVQPGEHIIIVPEATNPNKKPPVTDNISNWQKWWRLFF